MAAGNYDILIEQGATFERNITMTDSESNPIDITACTVRGQIRPTYTSSVNSAFSFTITDAAAGEIYWYMPAEITESIDTTKGLRWVYDVEVEFPSGIVERILMGKVTISPEVTR